MGDWVLIKSFIKERWTVMWPRPFYCSIAAMYKGSTGVITTYLTVRLVDAVFYPWEKDSEESAESISNSLAIAGGIAAGLVCTTLLSVFADYFIVRNRGTSTTRSSLRNWIVSQLLWADDERLSMTKMSLYLNAATNEVQEVSNWWANPLISFLSGPKGPRWLECCFAQSSKTYKTTQNRDIMSFLPLPPSLYKVQSMQLHPQACRHVSHAVTIIDSCGFRRLLAAAGRVSSGSSRPSHPSRSPSASPLSSTSTPALSFSFSASSWCPKAPQHPYEILFLWLSASLWN